MNAWDDFADRLELFFGDATDTVAHVYARLRGVEQMGEMQLTGTLTGPSCLYAKTLKATFTFADRGPGDSILAEAIVPEPCFWTPEMPQLYQADLELRGTGERLARATHVFGIRLLGAAGRKLMFDGKGWVLRAVARGEVPPAELEHWRESDAAMVVSNPDDELCREASRIGVLLVAELDAPKLKTLSSRGRGQDKVTESVWALNEIRRLSRWPAVGMVIVPGRQTFEPPGMAHNVLLAEVFGPEEVITPAGWADVAVCELRDPDHWKARTANCKVPMIAQRPSAVSASVAEARALCDLLQRDLAGRGEIAGYIV